MNKKSNQKLHISIILILTETKLVFLRNSDAFVANDVENIIYLHCQKDKDWNPKSVMGKNENNDSHLDMRESLLFIILIMLR